MLYYQYRKFKKQLFAEAKKVLDAGSAELSYKLLESYPVNFGQWLQEISYRIRHGDD